MLCFLLSTGERKVYASLLQVKTSFCFVLRSEDVLNDCTLVHLFVDLFLLLHTFKKIYEEPYNLKPLTTPRVIMNPADYQTLQGSPQLFLSLADY